MYVNPRNLYNMLDLRVLSFISLLALQNRNVITYSVDKLISTANIMILLQCQVTIGSHNYLVEINGNFKAIYCANL